MNSMDRSCGKREQLPLSCWHPEPCDVSSNSKYQQRVERVDEDVGYVKRPRIGPDNVDGQRITQLGQCSPRLTKESYGLLQASCGGNDVCVQNPREIVEDESVPSRARIDRNRKQKNCSIREE